MKSSLLLALLLSLALPGGLPAITATGMSSFEGIEEPKVRYAPGSKTFTPDNFINITESAERTFRMSLRYRADEWDGDRDTPNKDRQRAEVKGLGPHQKHGDTFDYTTTWRTNASFRGTSRFCHIFQLKATDGDNGAPLITVSIREGTKRASLQYWPGAAKSSITAREFEWTPGVWQTIRVRVKTSPHGDGEVLASVNGDEFQGVRGVAVFRPEASDYRPKWGLYRGVTPESAVGDDYVEHRNVSAEKVGSVALQDLTRLESYARKQAKKNPARALQWLQRQPPSPDRTQAVVAILALWAETQPAAAMARAEQLDPAEGRFEAIQHVFNRWVDGDVDEALHWIAQRAPDTTLDPLLWYLVTDTTLRYVDAGKALQGAPLITEPGLRARAIEHVVLIWARHDLPAAIRYVEASPALDSTQRKTILGEIHTLAANAGKIGDAVLLAP